MRPTPKKTMGLPMSREINHGKPNPHKMSKMLDPRALETAMSPSPLRAAAMEANASGIEVPAARKTKPINKGGIPTVAPKRVAASTMTYDTHAMWHSAQRKHRKLDPVGDGI